MQPGPLPRHTITVARCFVFAAGPIYVYDLLRRTADHLTDQTGEPFGADFVNYWSGAYLAWHGRASEIYHPAAFHAFEQSIAGPLLDGRHYSYPPVLLLLTAPLALMPFVPALFAWLAASWYAFYRALRLAVPGQDALLLALATAAVFINAIAGQNGAWSAALLGGGLSLLERRPLLAGGLLGLLIYKPQLGLLLPVALLAGRQWRAFIATAVAATVLLGASVIGFGTDVWAEHLRLLTALRDAVLEDGTGVWHRFVSVFVMARRFGASIEVAYAVQALTGVLAAAAVAWVWLRDEPANLRNAVLLLGTCLATPYLQDYDLVFGAFAVAWLWQHSTVTVSDRTLLISAGLVLVLPLVAAALGQLTGLALGPLFIAPLFIVALRMSFAPRTAALTQTR